MRESAGRMCNGFHLRERNGFVTVTHLCYHFQCGFFNYLKCVCQLRILVPFNQCAELTRYYDTHPDVSRPELIHGTLYTPQTMTLVSAKSGLRPQVHKTHLCFIETTGSHMKHNGTMTART